MDMTSTPDLDDTGRIPLLLLEGPVVMPNIFGMLESTRQERLKQEQRQPYGQRCDFTVPPTLLSIQANRLCRY